LITVDEFSPFDRPNEFSEDRGGGSECGILGINITLKLLSMYGITIVRFYKFRGGGYGVYSRCISTKNYAACSFRLQKSRVIKIPLRLLHVFGGVSGARDF
jgi:hypothetical protein